MVTTKKDALEFEKTLSKILTDQELNGELRKELEDVRQTLTRIS